MAGLSASRTAPVQLLDLNVGGRVFRVASKAVDVTTNRGDTLRYEPGLSPLELGVTRSFGGREIDIEIASRTDWPLIEARGIALEDRAATVRLWFEGDTLEQAQVYARGTADDVQIGRPGEPLVFTLRESVERRAVTLPGAQAACTEDTWPVRVGYTLSEAAVGVSYPVIIGYPGDHPKLGAVTDIAEPAFHAPRVEFNDPGHVDERWLIALGTIEAAQIELMYLDDATKILQTTTESVSTTEDALGVTVSYVQQSSLADEDTKYWAGLRRTSGFGGGVTSPYTGNALNGFGEVALYLLDYFTALPVDRGRMQAFRDFFDRFKIDAVLGQSGPVRVTEWLEQVLRHIPGMLVDGRDGIYIAPLRWDATKQDRVAHIDVDQGGAQPVGAPAVWGEEVRNDFTIDYRPRYAEFYVSRRVLTSIENTRGGALTGGVTFPPGSSSLPWYASAEEDVRISGSSLLRASQARFGHRPLDTIEIDWCWHDDTAHLILYYLAQRMAWPKRSWRIQGGHSLEPLQPGDIVTLTSADYRLDEALAIVIERTTNLRTVAVDLVIIDSPRTARLTS